MLKTENNQIVEMVQRTIKKYDGLFDPTDEYQSKA